MSMIDDLLADAGERMTKSVEAMRHEFGTVRTGRATPGLLDRITVDYYGAVTPLKQLATVNAPEARLLTVQPYDRSSIKAIERAIMESDVGLTPSNDGNLIRLSIPELTEERRKQLVKKVHALGEEAKTAVRQIRREANEEVKRIEKAGGVSEDDARRGLDDVQKKTDRFSGEIDTLCKNKERELMEV